MKKFISVFLAVSLSILVFTSIDSSRVSAVSLYEPQKVYVNKTFERAVYYPGTSTYGYFTISGYYSTPSGPQNLNVSLRFSGIWYGGIKNITYERRSNGGLKVTITFWNRGPYYDSVYSPPHWDGAVFYI